MLLNLGHDYQPDLKKGLGAFIAFATAGLLAGLLARQFGGAEENPIYQFFPGPEGMDQLLEEQGAIGSVAFPLFTDYVLAFELVGILLLVALVGAVALAKRKV
jgi:NADH:ubiquinone oxidoreductase subunit 6 (subunit J)